MSIEAEVTIADKRNPFFLPIFFISNTAGIVETASPTNIILAGNVANSGSGVISDPINPPVRNTILVAELPIIWHKASK